jgi:murein DD-endopeptidase MepM/ murein hydrolase activator NlpD
VWLGFGLGCGGKAPATDTLEADTSATDTGEEIPRAELQLALPLSDPDAISLAFICGVDHDPVTYTGFERARCLDYAGRGFPWCYDEHEGSDYMLDGGFSTMDAGSTPVVAAAPGVVESAEDGHYDRCHADAGKGGNSCDGEPMIANSVILAHDTGQRTLYWHLKSGSVAVTVGEHVAAGALLGLVGSSGNSSAPHLHFGLEDSLGRFIDPYAGPNSQSETWWCDQGDPEGLPGACP